MINFERSETEYTNLENESSAIARLEEYRNQGYLFHGSPNPSIRIFEPRQAQDVNPERIFNSDKAVYAATSPVTAIIFGLANFSPGTSPELINRPWSAVGTETGARVRMPLVWKPYIEQNKGYVYVLPKDTFELRGWQAKSTEPVPVYEKIQVTLDDFYKMGGEIEWYE